MLKSNLGKKASFTFYQILGLAVSFLALLLFLSVKLYSKLFLFGESLLGKLKTVCGCDNLLSFSNHPIIFTALILLSLTVVAFFILSIIKIIRLKWLTNRFVKKNLQNKKLKLSRQLKKVSKMIGLENQIIEINNQKPVIFCFGLIRPMVCISSGFVKQLSDRELRAVLLHEQHHLFSREPVRIFIVKSITKALFFLPGLKSFANQYLTFSELAADQWATNNFQDKMPLAGALYKLITWKRQMIIKNELALSFFANPIIEERVNKLADGEYNPKFKFFISKLSISIIFLSFLFLNGMFFLNNPIMVDHDVASCSNINSDFSQQEQCKAFLKETVCTESYGLKTSLCEFK